MLCLLKCVMVGKKKKSFTFQLHVFNFSKKIYDYVRYTKTSMFCVQSLFSRLSVCVTLLRIQYYFVHSTKNFNKQSCNNLFSNNLQCHILVKFRLTFDRGILHLQFLVIVLLIL